ncbi:hypothetical protein [Niveispirillum sp. KHB5.9]|uniref:hypothetical protein n=1 Tax=Niveispirillum sp. KHB5.9 TaxID=3400269 RepID=UPI003A8695F1
MLLAGSDAILALACLWAGWVLLTLPGGNGGVRLLGAAILALSMPSAAGAARFGGVEGDWLPALHQGASDLYALVGFASAAAALFLVPDGRRWPLVLGIAVLLVAGLALMGQKALVGPLASLFILAGTVRLMRVGPGRLWLGLSMAGVVVAALTRVPGLLDTDARIIGLHLGLALWVAALGAGVRAYSSSVPAPAYAP